MVKANCLIKHYAMKLYTGSEGTAPRILNLDNRWRLVVSFTPRYSLDRRMGGPHSQSGRGKGKVVPVLN
jgi:hypothetical protein